MGLLNRLGLARKKARPVGQTLEKGRGSEGPQRRKNLLVKAGLFLVLIVLTLLAFPRGDVYEYLVQVGDVWRQERLEAPFDFSIYKDPEQLAQERREVRYAVPAYFAPVPNVEGQILASRDTVEQHLEQVFRAYADFRAHQAQEEFQEARTDSLRYMELRRNAPLRISQEQWEILLRSYTEGRPGAAIQTLGLGGPPLHEQLLDAVSDLALSFVEMRGVLNVPADSIYAEEIVIRDDAERTETDRALDEVYGLNEAYLEAQSSLQEQFEDEEVARLAYALFRAIFEPSLAYQRSETLQAWQAAEDKVWPTQGFVREGEVIVDRGDRVTAEIKRKLTSLERVQAERRGDVIEWRITLGQLLLTISIYILFFLYLFLLRRQIFDENRQVLLVILLFAGIVGLYAIAIRMPTVAMYAVPVAVTSVLITVMFDSRVGLFATLTLALLGGLLLNYNFEFTLATVFAGALGVFSVRDIKNRGQFFLSAGLVFVGYFTVLGATWLLNDTPTDRFARDVLLVGINSFLLIIAYPLLWVFERSFDITTDLSLLELSDTNRPLLKELSLRSPGTFNHSLQVANLSEAAADSIGANALLTRVGALYHDIGKMLKPEYFVENQRPGQNPHDQLKPRMSSLIIASHVKEGLEMGRQYNLPQRVLKFIPMHHGTTRIEYFYRKAIEQRGPEEPPVQESEFRYPGPRPDSKETGILMLSDSVEAASRSLSDPTHKRLETLIDMIFKARIEDGQLDGTDLTFRDLNQIKETFLAMLLGIYHVRVKYPGQKEGREEADAKAPPSPPPASARPAAQNYPDRGTVGIPEQSVGGKLNNRSAPEEATRNAPAEEGVSGEEVEEGVSGEEAVPKPTGDGESPQNAQEPRPDRRNGIEPLEIEDESEDESEEELDLDPARRAQNDEPDAPEDREVEANVPARERKDR